MSSKNAKRGQFYLIASLIIAAIIGGLITIENYAITQPEPVKFYDLSQNFEAQTTKIVDYGVYQNKEEVDKEIKNFTEKFITYATEKDKRLGIVYVFGNKNEVKLLNCADAPVTVAEKTIESCKTEVSSDINLQISKDIIVKGKVKQGAEAFVPVGTTLRTPGSAGNCYRQ